jgi:hypothetical protein
MFGERSSRHSTKGGGGGGVELKVFNWQDEENIVKWDINFTTAFEKSGDLH